MRRLPYTGGDLRKIADLVDAADKIIDAEGMPTGNGITRDRRRPPEFLTSPLLGRIEVLRPDSDGERAGWLEPAGSLGDLWYGFMPEGSEQVDE